MKYTITIREILENNVDIEADSYYEAEEKARELYKNQEVVLTADDCVETEFESNVEAQIANNMFQK